MITFIYFKVIKVRYGGKQNSQSGPILQYTIGVSSGKVKNEAFASIAFGCDELLGNKHQSTMKKKLISVAIKLILCTHFRFCDLFEVKC